MGNIEARSWVDIVPVVHSKGYERAKIVKLVSPAFGFRFSRLNICTFISYAHTPLSIKKPINIKTTMSAYRRSFKVSLRRRGNS